MTEQSVADGLQNVVAGLGTDRDKRSYSVYGLPRPLSQGELENMYRSSWLAKRVVNAVADDMTRAWREFLFDDDNEEHQFAVETAEKALGVKKKVNEALRWARLYGGSVIVIGTNEADLAAPLIPESVKKGGLRYLHVLDRHRISHDAEVTTDLNSPNFGLPERYTIAEGSLRVHHSRVLRFNGQKLPYYVWQANSYWDDSELQHVFDSITNCDTATAAIATMMFEANVDVVKFEGLENLLSTKEGEQKMIQRFQTAAMLKSINRMFVLGTGDEYEKKSNNFSGLDAIVRQFMVDVCGAADIPMTRLFGQSAGGLNATGDNDIRNYYDMLKAKQEAELRSQLDRLDEVMIRSVLGTMPPNYRYEFKSLWQMSDTERANLEKVRADRDKVYLDAGVITEGVIARDLKEYGTYKSMTDDDVELAEELAKNPPEKEPGATNKPGEKKPEGENAGG